MAALAIAGLSFVVVILSFVYRKRTTKLILSILAILMSIYSTINWIHMLEISGKLSSGLKSISSEHLFIALCFAAVGLIAAIHAVVLAVKMCRARQTK